MPGSLTSDQLKSYHEDGFVKPIRAFSPERALEIRKDIEQIERECAEADKPVDINQYFRVNGQIVIPLLYEITRTEPVLDAVESVLGPNLLAWSCELFIKDAGSEKIVSWHQDMTYWTRSLTSSVFFGFQGAPSDRRSGSKVCPVSIILQTTLRRRSATLRRARAWPCPRLRSA